MVRSTFSAAQQQTLLRGLTKRRGNQRECQQQHKRNGEDAAHLSIIISQQGLQFQRNITLINSPGRIAR